MALPRPVGWVDVVLAGSMCAAGQIELWAGRRVGGIGAPPGPGAPVLLLALLVLPATLPLAALRRRPLLASTVVAATLVAQVCLVAPTVSLLAGLLPLLVSTFGAAAFGSRTTRGVSLLAALAVQSAAVVRIPEERAGGEVSFGLFVLVGGWLLGTVVGHRLRRAEAEVSASQQRAAEQHERAERIAAQERLRIARELHDVIAHGVSLMGVQAAAARVMIERDPRRAEMALHAVEEQARDSIAELQRLLGVLRAPEDDDPRSSPRLASLPQLVAGMREAGVPVELEVAGEPRALSPGADQAAYRVVQEALTNVLKHAGQAPVRVALAWRATGLAIEVADAGGAVRAPDRGGGAGRGLVGMQERVLLYGGTMTAEPRPGGGFVVAVELPVAGAAA